VYTPFRLLSRVSGEILFIKAFFGRVQEAVMVSKKVLFLLIAIPVVVSGFLTAVIPTFAASKYKVLYRFKNNDKDAAQPSGPLIFDAAGNLYGTSLQGGVYGREGGDAGYGTVFQLIPGRNGKWKEKLLRSFNGTDGYNPNGGVTFDAAGNLYGTTYNDSNAFQLTPGANGKWTEKVLYSFSGGSDGFLPNSSVIFDAAGNLYGTTSWGGDPICSCGVVFELSPSANGSWTEKVLHTFIGGKDGTFPNGVVFDAAGNLYGTTYGGGLTDRGTVFELTPGANGQWSETVLHTFNGKDGSHPETGLIVDAAGKLYGTTTYGGVLGSGCNESTCGTGTVFRLTPGKEGEWKEKVLHSFRPDGKDGSSPDSSLSFDANGNLYGTTYTGGIHGSYGFGTVFRLAPGANDKWKETVLHKFSSGGDGGNPASGLIVDGVGNLYGTAENGGNHGLYCQCGTVFEITP